MAQTFDHHTRYYPPFHFFALPIVAIHALMQTYALVRAPGALQAWSALVAWAIAIGFLSARAMSLRVQDRVIRLEETLRMQRLLPAELLAQAGALAPRQLVALRFASDHELADLVRRTLAGEFASPRAIKQAVQQWRPDLLRA